MVQALKPSTNRGGRRKASTYKSRKVVPLETARKGAASPRRGVRNKDRRPRGEYLRPEEIERLIQAVWKAGRHGHRDKTIIQMMFNHGLRVSEAVDLRWDDIDFRRGSVHVRRLKSSYDSVQEIRGKEMRALRRLQRDYPKTPYVFNTERGGPLTRSTVQKMIVRAGELSGLQDTLGVIHPHMLRHSTGFALANKGIDTRTIQGYLGHVNIQHVVKYTELAAGRFKGISPSDD